MPLLAVITLLAMPTAIRMQRLEERLWPKDVDPVEISIEIFGLGRGLEKHTETRLIELSLDLIQMIAERYGMSTENLTKPAIIGFPDSVKERFGKRYKTDSLDQARQAPKEE